MSGSAPKSIGAAPTASLNALMMDAPPETEAWSMMKVSSVAANADASPARSEAIDSDAGIGCLPSIERFEPC
jgi:hypothetical protein